MQLLNCEIHLYNMRCPVIEQGPVTKFVCKHPKPITL